MPLKTNAQSAKGSLRGTGENVQCDGYITNRKKIKAAFPE